MILHCNPGRACLFLVVAAMGCNVSLPLGEADVVLCGSSARCPGGLVCVRDIGQCVARGSTCTEARADGVYAASDGNACARGDGSGTCNRGVCTRCGDGVVENGESCDDGNDDSNDGCTVRCEVAICGDGVLTAPPEACDDGNTNANDGCAACQRVTWQPTLAYGIGPVRSDLPTLSLPGITAIAAGPSGLTYVATRTDGVVGTIPVSVGTLWSISEASQVLVRVAGLDQAERIFGLREVQQARETALPPITGITFGERGVIYLSLSGVGIRHVVAIDNGVLRIIAGTGDVCAAASNDDCGDEGPARTARLREPGPLVFDGGGLLHFADGPGIRVIDREGTVRTFAGGGTPCTSGVCGEGMQALDALFGRITGLSFDAANNLYVADGDQGRLRRLPRGVAGGRPPVVERLRDVPGASAILVVPGAILYASSLDGAGVTTYDVTGDRPYLGTGVVCTDLVCGDDALALAARVRNVVGLAAGADRHVLVADAGLKALRRVSDGVVRRVAGGRPPVIVSGALATSRRLTGAAIAPLANGDLAVASGNVLFRYRATTGTLEHLAGAGPVCDTKCDVEGAAFTVGFRAISDLATSGETIFIADAGSRRVLELADGMVRVVAGTGEPCAAEPCADTTDARTLQLTEPSGIAVDAAAIYVTTNHTVWRIDRGSGAATRVAGSTAGFGDAPVARDALFECARDVSIADDGGLLVADYRNCAIRRIDAGGVTTVMRDAACAALEFGSECGRLLDPVCTGMLLPTSVDAHAGGLTLANDCEQTVEDMTLPSPTNRALLAGGAASTLEGLQATELAINRPRFTFASDGRLIVMDTEVPASRVWRIDASTTRTRTIVGDADGGTTGPRPLVELGPIVAATAIAPGTAFLLDAGYGRVRRSTDALVETVIGHSYGVELERPNGTDPLQAPSRIVRPLATVGGIAFAPATSTLFVSEANSILVTELVGDDPSLWTTLSFAVFNEATGSVDLGALATSLDGTQLFAADRTRHIVYAITVDERASADYASARIIAGRDGFVGSQGDGGDALNASLDTPSALAVSPSGALYIADAGGHRIRRVAQGTITTVLGTGFASNDADGAPARERAVDTPRGLVFDTFGNLVVVGRDAVRLVFTDSAECGEPCGDATVETIYRGTQVPAQQDLASCLAAPFLGSTPDVLEVGDACSGGVLRLTRLAPD